MELFVDKPITTPQLAAFLQKLLEALPSSSTPVASSKKPRPEIAIGELLVDVFWSIEMQVEDHLCAAKMALNVNPRMIEKQSEEHSTRIAEEGNHVKRLSSSSVSPAERKRRAEAGKEILFDFLRQLLVRTVTSIFNKFVSTYLASGNVLSKPVSVGKD